MPIKLSCRIVYWIVFYTGSFLLSLFMLLFLLLFEQYKERGALNKLLCLTPEESKKGVVCSSAGNHAQAVSHHATRLGIDCKIVMPKTTPFNKVVATRDFGAKVILHGMFSPCLCFMLWGISEFLSTYHYLLFYNRLMHASKLSLFLSPSLLPPISPLPSHTFIQSFDLELIHRQ